MQLSLPCYHTYIPIVQHFDTHGIIVIYRFWRVSIVNFSSQASFFYDVIATQILIMIQQAAMIPAFITCLLATDAVYSDSHGKPIGPSAGIGYFWASCQVCIRMSIAVCSEPCISQPILCLLCLRPSHLEFCFQATIFSLNSKWLESQTTWQNPKWFCFVTWDMLSRCDIIICILYHLEFICVTFYGKFCNICAKRSQYSVHW